MYKSNELNRQFEELRLKINVEFCYIFRGPIQHVLLGAHPSTMDYPAPQFRGLNDINLMYYAFPAMLTLKIKGFMMYYMQTETS